MKKVLWFIAGLIRYLFTTKGLIAMLVGASMAFHGSIQSFVYLLMAGMLMAGTEIADAIRSQKSISIDTLIYNKQEMKKDGE